MHAELIEFLICPACHGPLDWTIDHQTGQQLETGQARCRTCQAVYPIRDGIGLFLTPDLPRNDLWEQVDSGLNRYLLAQPDIERQLLSGSLHELSPADQFFRSQVLEERGQFAEAAVARELAWPQLYTPDYIACSIAQIDGVIHRLAETSGPIVDLATGKGYLVEAMARQLDRLIVATDFSPRILRQNRRKFAFLGLADRISLLAFDARRTPFKDKRLPTMTTFLGLVNIEAPGSLLAELRRIVGGRLLAVNQFYPPTDEANAAVIQQAKLTTLLYRDSTLAAFAEAGWQVEIIQQNPALVRPTPTSVLLNGTGIDGLPVAETTIDWCLISAT